MKKLVCVTFLLIFFLAGCNKNEDEISIPTTYTPKQIHDSERIETVPTVSIDIQENKQSVLLTTPTPGPEPYSVFDTEKEIEVGDVVVMGNYSHDDKFPGGYPQIPIQWLVLEKKDNCALLLSLYNIDAEAYYDECYQRDVEMPEKVTWENCSLRVWLNDVFLQQAFFQSEQECIVKTSVQTPDNAVYGTDGGGDTSDYVFLLSEEEVKQYFNSDEERKTQTAPEVEREQMDLAMAGQVWFKPTDYFGWWLRTPGENGEMAVCVDCFGKVNSSGVYVWDEWTSVRPALWLDLTKAEKYKAYLRQENSEGRNKKEYDDPVKFQELLSQLPEYDKSSDGFVLSYETVMKYELYDTYYKPLKLEEGSLERLREIGAEWSRSAGNNGVKEMRANYNVLKMGHSWKTLFTVYEQYWEVPAMQNHYIPKKFSIMRIAGTDQIKEINLCGYIGEEETKEELIKTVNVILEMLGSNLIYTKEDLNRSIWKEAFTIHSSCNESLDYENQKDYYRVRIFY